MTNERSPKAPNRRSSREERPRSRDRSSLSTTPKLAQALDFMQQPPTIDDLIEEKMIQRLQLENQQNSEAYRVPAMDVSCSSMMDLSIDTNNPEGFDDSYRRKTKTGVRERRPIRRTISHGRRSEGLKRSGLGYGDSHMENAPVPTGQRSPRVRRTQSMGLGTMDASIDDSYSEDHLLPDDSSNRRKTISTARERKPVRRTNSHRRCEGLKRSSLGYGKSPAENAPAPTGHRPHRARRTQSMRLGTMPGDKVPAKDVPSLGSLRHKRTERSRSTVLELTNSNRSGSLSSASGVFNPTGPSRKQRVQRTRSMGLGMTESASTPPDANLMAAMSVSYMGPPRQRISRSRSIDATQKTPIILDQMPLGGLQTTKETDAPSSADPVVHQRGNRSSLLGAMFMNGRNSVSSSDGTPGEETQSKLDNSDDRENSIDERLSACFSKQGNFARKGYGHHKDRVEDDMSIDSSASDLEYNASWQINDSEVNPHLDCSDDLGYGDTQTENTRLSTGSSSGRRAQRISRSRSMGLGNVSGDHVPTMDAATARREKRAERSRSIGLRATDATGSQSTKNPSEHRCSASATHRRQRVRRSRSMGLGMTHATSAPSAMNQITAGNAPSLGPLRQQRADRSKSMGLGFEFNANRIDRAEDHEGRSVHRSKSGESHRKSPTRKKGQTRSKKQAECVDTAASDFQFNASWKAKPDAPPAHQSTLSSKDRDLADGISAMVHRVTQRDHPTPRRSLSPKRTVPSKDHKARSDCRSKSGKGHRESASNRRKDRASSEKELLESLAQTQKPKDIKHAERLAAASMCAVQNRAA